MSVFSQSPSLWCHITSLFNPKRAYTITQKSSLHAIGIFDEFYPSIPSMVKWMPPPLGAFKLNTDSYYKDNPGLSIGAAVFN